MRYAGRYGTWQLDDLQGCSQVCVSHSAFVLYEYRKQGLGTNYHQQRLEQMKELNYDYSICTIDATNVAQRKILVAAGWTMLDQFKSSKTEHFVQLWGKHL